MAKQTGKQKPDQRGKKVQGKQLSTAEGKLSARQMKSVKGGSDPKKTDQDKKPGYNVSG